MATRQYIGARYVPQFYENPDTQDAEWKAGVVYEPLTMVTYNSATYTSKKEVPSTIGDPAANPIYWVATGNYNGQIAYLQAQIGTLADLTTTDKDSLVDALNEVDGNLKNITAYVTPQMYGAIGDGVTDDTSAIRQALNSGMNVIFPFGTYLISDEIDIEPAGVNYSQTGRCIDFQKSVILASNNISYCFRFKGGAWPNNLRNLTVKNVAFDGTVTRCAILFDASSMWFSTVSDVIALTSFTAPALLEFNSNIANSNGGLNAIFNIHGSNYVQNTLLFSVASGADTHFDDFYIRNITNIFNGTGTGCTIKLDEAYLVYSTLMLLYAGNNANILYTSNGAYLLNSSVSNVYHEPNFNNYATMTASSVDCKYEEFNTKQRNDGDTGIIFTGQTNNSTFRQFSKTKNDGTELTDAYIRIIGSGENNTFEKIGSGAPDRSVRFPSGSKNNRIVNGYNDPVLYARSVNHLEYNSGTVPVSDILLAPLEKDVLDFDSVHCKILGKVTGTNAFTIELKGTGVSRTLLNHSGSANGFFEIDLDLPRRAIGYFEYFVKSYFNGVLEYAGVDGTPDANMLITPTDLALRLSVSACSTFYISEIVIERIPYYENRPSDT